MYNVYKDPKGEKLDKSNSISISVMSMKRSLQKEDSSNNVMSTIEEEPTNNDKQMSQ